jgi:hypothetical protein
MTVILGDKESRSNWHGPIASAFTFSINEMSFRMERSEMRNLYLNGKIQKGLLTCQSNKLN